MRIFPILLLLCLWICIKGIDNYHNKINDKNNDRELKEKSENLNFGNEGSFYDNEAYKSFIEVKKLKRKTSGNFWIFLCLFISAFIVSVIYLFWDIVYQKLR